jgi:hypothetical protein
MLSATGFANNKITNKLEVNTVYELPKEVRIEYSYDNQKVTIVKSFNNNDVAMQKFIDAELDKMELKMVSLNNLKPITCSATVHVGTANNYIEVTVTGPCGEIAAEVKKLKAQLLAAL